MKNKYPLPKDVTSILKDVEISNFSLLFHRYIPYKSQNGWKMEGQDKSNIWQQLIEKSPISYGKEQEESITSASEIFNSKELNEIFKSLCIRLAETRENCAKQNLEVQYFRMKVVWRLAIGLATPSILDTGMSLHRIYGIPYLSGSTIKGNSRHYWLKDLGESLGVIPVVSKDKNTPWNILEEILVSEIETKKDLHKLENLFQQLTKHDQLLEGRLKSKNISFEELYESSKPFRRVFGSTNVKGEVVFFDAFPTKLLVNSHKEPSKKVPIIELDIINTHYQGYYTDSNTNSIVESTPPADYLSPVPVYFLTIHPNTSFRFLLAAKDKEILNIATNWVKRTASEQGIGAKTTSGYGQIEYQE